MSSRSFLTLPVCWTAGYTEKSVMLPSYILMSQQEKGETIMANNVYAQQLNINSKPGQTEAAAQIASNAMKEASRQ
jgi:hypothetical protein